MARASSIEQGLAPKGVMPTVPQGRPVPTGSVVPDGSSGSQEQETAPQDAMKWTKTMEVAMKTGTGRTCEAATCSLLAGTRVETQEQDNVIWEWTSRSSRQW